MTPAYEKELSDETLVAYIDGELTASEKETVVEALSQNADARERLEMLKRGGRPFSEAFDVLLSAAPGDKLQEMFGDLAGKTEPGSGADMHRGDNEKVVPSRPRKQIGGIPFLRMAAAAAILALVFVGGLLTGGFFEELTQGTQQKPGWREAATHYVALFSKETFHSMSADQQQRQANLKQVEMALGVQLSGDRIANPELVFQGAQLLQFEGEPLAQISYLHDGQIPVALCIIRSSDPPATPAKETRHGLNIVHWVAGEYAYMVIGNIPDEELSHIAETFHKRFS